MDVRAEDVQVLMQLMDFLTPRQRNMFLKSMNKKQMRVLEVACFNLATNHRGLTKRQEEILSKFKRQIETIASKEYKLGDKRKIVTQKGGFIGALLPLIGTVIGSFLASR